MEERLLKLGISLTESQLAQLDTYYELLAEWNSFMNLTGITQYDQVLLKHFVDSLSIQKVTDLKQKAALNLIDVGTGAGFPGLPIKIAFPHHRVTLLDSLNKRIQFLNQVIEKNGLKEIETIHGRAEDFAGRREYRGQYDLALSRAVANLSTLAEYCLPFVKKGGRFVAYKSGEYRTELEEAQNALSLLGAEVEREEVFTLPDTDIERSLIVIKKIKDTPKRFPRKAGIPSREPLK